MENAPVEVIDSKRVKTPIITEAFRFVHIAKPDIYSGETMERDFISHPSSDDSVFLRQPEAGETPESVFGSALQSFAPLRSLTEVRNLNSQVSTFSFWLKKNKARLSMESLGRELKSLVTLDATQKVLLWDNLFYQGATNQSPTVREAVIRMLQADNFIEKYQKIKPDTENVLDYLNNVAVASIIMPLSLMPKRPEIERANTSALDDLSRSILTRKLEFDIASHRIREYGCVIEELEKAECVYREEVMKEREDALALYKDTVKDDDGTGTTRPFFSFTPKNPMDKAYLANSLSPKTLSFVESIRTTCHTSFGNLIREVDRLIAKEDVKVLDNSEKPKKTLVYSGMRIPVRNRPMGNSYAIRAVPSLVGDSYSLYLTQYFNERDRRIRRINMDGSSGIGAGNEAPMDIIAESDNHVTFQVFPDGIPMDDKETFDIKGEFEAENNTLNGSFDIGGFSSGGTVADVSPVRPPSGYGSVPSNLNVPIYGVTNIGVAEFKRVESELCCYVEGEVSHIDNIMAREYKERSTRSLTRSEITTERTKEREVEDLTDTTSTDRSELQSEISKTLQEDKSKDFGASASVSGTKFGITLSAAANFSTSSSSSQSNNFSESASYAKEVTDRAMKRIVSKVTEKRTSKMIREFEETNKHGFDNREGTEHVTGIYRWLDKIYENRLMNYGKRLVYEFMIPEPSRNFKHYLGKNAADRVTDCDVRIIEEPKKPSAFGITAFDKITEGNYAKLAKEYGAEVEPPMDETINLARAFAEQQIGIPDSERGAFAYEVEIPEGYLANRYYGMFTCLGGTSEWVQMRVSVGNFTELVVNGVDKEIIQNDGYGFLPKPEGILPVSVITHDIESFKINISVFCYRKDEAHKKWQNLTYLSIMEAYNERLRAYKEAMAEECVAKNQVVETEDGNNYRINPVMARAIEQRELKRVALEMITKPFGFSIGRENYVKQLLDCSSNYDVKQNAGFANHIAHVKFLEEAVDWEIMSYTLYPYYWANEDLWGDLLKTTSESDYIFQSFLQSGMAKMLVPVRAGYEKAFMFYMDTGTIWNSDSIVSDNNDGLYQSIIDELQLELNEEGYPMTKDENGNPILDIEATWKTRIPTSLTVIQKYAASLDDDGLPCACDETKSIAHTQDKKHNILGTITGSDDTGGV